MHIGVDLDNTIICYDSLFHALALERGWILPDVSVCKEAVRNAVHLLAEGDEKWQELQAEAYGPCLHKAALFPGVEAAFQNWHEQGHDVYVISHKTRYSRKSGHDLHRSALAFLNESSLIRNGFLDRDRVFFCSSRDEKITKISAFECNIFIDDLFEVFSEPVFPQTVRKIHFAPDAQAVSPHDALVCRSWREIAAYDPKVDDLVRRVTARLPQRLEMLSGGRNSRVWKCEQAGAAPVILKQYHRDRRNRLATESSAFAFLHRHGLHCVPTVLATFPEQDIAIYSWIEGTPVTDLGDAPEAVEPFASFAEHLWCMGKSITPEALPLAAEACVSLAALITQVEERFARLHAVPGDTETIRLMRDFLQREAVPEWTRRVDAAKKGYARLNRAIDQELATNEQMLNPSDFGSHNAIRTPGGNFVYIDFEYFGWDDPVKLVSDFILHPGMRLTKPQKEYFQRRVMALLTDTDAPERLPLLLPLFAVKWACILLNEFLPVGSTPRHFAVRTPSASALEDQLEKARFMVRTTNQRLCNGVEHFE